MTSLVDARVGCGVDIRTGLLRMLITAQANWLSSALASSRSGVSKPSVNQP
jgi:hypothetical protein